MADLVEISTSNEVAAELIEAAKEFWDDDEWQISQTLWMDSDTDTYVHKRLGTDDYGRIRQERLYLLDGEIRAERNLIEERLIESKDLGVVSDR